MLWFAGSAVFMVGLVVGSFLNAFLYRLEIKQGLRSPGDNTTKDLTVWRGRSLCPRCGHVLSWYDLIPLLSFVMLRGKCRYCKEKISLQYPLVELVTAILFVLVFLNLIKGVDNLGRLSYPQVAEVLYLWAVISALVAVFVYDLKHFLIPDKVLYPAIGLVVFWQLLDTLVLHPLKGVDNLIGLSLAGLGAAAFFFLIYFFSKGRAMGFGDVKLALLMGLFLGWLNILVALFVAFVLGAVLGLGLMLFQKKGWRSEVPFGPFLVVGTFSALFFGEPLVDIYLGLVLL